MRKLRTSVLALTTIASLTLGGTAVATAEETAAGSVQQGSSAEANAEGNTDAAQQGSVQQGSSKDGEQKGSAQTGSSAKTEAEAEGDTDGDTTAKNDGSLNRDKGWIPGHSFGSTLQTDYVPAWAKIWIAVVTIVGIVTAGLFAAPGITAMKMHNIIPSFH